MTRANGHALIGLAPGVCYNSDSQERPTKRQEAQYDRGELHHLLRLSLTLRLQRSRVAVESQGNHRPGY